MVLAGPNQNIPRTYHWPSRITQFIPQEFSGATEVNFAYANQFPEIFMV